MHVFGEKYNKNLEKNNKYILEGKYFNTFDIKEDPFAETLLYLIWGDKVTNIIKYGVILSGIFAAIAYTTSNTDYTTYGAIIIGLLGIIITGVIAYMVNVFEKSKIEDILLIGNSCSIDYMQNNLNGINYDKLSSEYLIFNGCADTTLHEYLKSEVATTYASTSEIKKIAFDKHNLYGLSNFLDIPNVRKMYIIRERKKIMDKYWSRWISETGIDEAIDLNQMYNDLYMFAIYDIVNTGGEGLTKEQKIKITEGILDSLDVESKVSVEEHVKNLEDNIKYKEYMVNCFYQLDADKSNSAGAFWQILSCKRDGNGKLLYNNIRFLEEFRRFYVQIIIFLFDMHLYNENTFISIMNVIVLYYLLSKDIDNKSVDNAKKKENLVNVLAPIEINMEKFLEKLT